MDEKDYSPQSSGARPVTMPVVSRRSPDAQLRSSSSSYHSASNYDEPEDHGLASYPYNVQPPVPRTLVKSAERRRALPSPSFQPPESRATNEGPHESGSSGMSDDSRLRPSFRIPASRPHSGVGSGGGVSSSGRLSPDVGVVREFREAVRNWNCEVVEGVLSRGSGGDIVDVVVREKVCVRVC